MKRINLKPAVLIVGACLGLNANASVTYLLTVINSSKMPLSAGALYVQDGQKTNAAPGQVASAGLVQLCQMGDPSLRLRELMANPTVHSATKTDGHIEPGESLTLEIEVADPKTQSLHFETMYGKTKDACAVIGAGSHGLVALHSHVTTALTGRDDAILTGAFSEPALPAGQTYLDATVCVAAADAVACLRELSKPSGVQPRVRFFSPYLASTQMFLEKKYGAAETLPLLFAETGAVYYEVKLKH